MFFGVSATAVTRWPLMEPESFFKGFDLSIVYLSSAIYTVTVIVLTFIDTLQWWPVKSSEITEQSAHSM